jgi:hypothetical protein
MKPIRLFIFSMVIALSACSGREDVSKKSEELSIPDLFKKAIKADPSKYNYVTVSASSVEGTVTQVNVINDFRTGNNAQGRPKLWIDSEYIDPSSMLTTYSFRDQAINNILPKFGKKVAIKIEHLLIISRSSGIESAEVYNPSLIKITNREKISVISKNEDLTITWEKDQNNDKPIGINLIARENISSGERIINISLTKAVIDTGLFTIDHADLQKFPSNSFIDIYITRGNQVISDSTAFTFYNSDLVEAKLF